MQVSVDRDLLKENDIKDYMTDEERTYFSNKLKEAEVFDEVHKETYSLDDIINKHREKYEI